MEERRRKRGGEGVEIRKLLTFDTSSNCFIDSAYCISYLSFARLLSASFPFQLHQGFAEMTVCRIVDDVYFAESTCIYARFSLYGKQRA